MARKSPTKPPAPIGLAAAIERRRVNTGRSYRNLADETLIPLTTLHRNLHNGDAFTLGQVQRIALAFDIPISQLMAEAEAGAKRGAA